MVRVGIIATVLALVAGLAYWVTSGSAAATNEASTDTDTTSLIAEQHLDGPRSARSSKKRPSLDLPPPGLYRIADTEPRAGEPDELYKRRMRALEDLNQFFEDARLTPEQEAWTVGLLGRAQDGFLRVAKLVAEKSPDDDARWLIATGSTQPEEGQLLADTVEHYNHWLRLELAKGLNERQLNRFRLYWGGIYAFATSRPLERQQ